MRSAPLLAWLATGIALLAPAYAQEAVPERRTLTGRAVDRDGRPVAGARVQFFAYEEFIDTAAMLRDAAHRTDETGRYRLTVPATHGRVLVVLPRRARSAFSMTTVCRKRSRSTPR
jgi:hypothetical protein